MSEIKALVAVRSGSERVKDKNLRSFSGKNLLEHKLEQLKRIPYLDGIVVNSDDDQMLAIAYSKGCEAVKRPEVYARAETSMSEVYKNMAENFPADIVVYCNATSPLISDSSIESAIETFYGMHTGMHTPDRSESVNSAHIVKQFLWHGGKPVNYDPQNQPRSQDLPDIYALNYAVSVIARQSMIRYKNIITPNCRLLTISPLEAVDIDTMLDFEVAEYLFGKYTDINMYSSHSL